VLKFTEEVTEGTEPTALPDPTEVTLVKDTELPLALTAELDLSTLAAGDTLTAGLRSDVKRKREVVVPKRAVARGRVTRVERYSDHIVLGLAFTDLDWDDKHAAVHGTLDRTIGLNLPLSTTRRWPVYRAEPGEGLLTVPTSQQHLIRGMLFIWRTDQ